MSAESHEANRERSTAAHGEGTADGGVGVIFLFLGNYEDSGKLRNGVNNSFIFVFENICAV